MQDKFMNGKMFNFFLNYLFLFVQLSLRYRFHFDLLDPQSHWRCRSESRKSPDPKHSILIVGARYADQGDHPAKK